MLAFPDKFALTVISQVILAAVFIAWLMAHLIANEYTAESVAKRAVELQFVKESTSRIKSLLKDVSDKSAAKKVERLYDILNSSSVKSDPGVGALERDIMSEIGSLESAIFGKDWEQIGQIADKMNRMAEERNRKLRLLN